MKLKSDILDKVLYSYVQAFYDCSIYIYGLDMIMSIKFEVTKMHFQWGQYLLKAHNVNIHCMVPLGDLDPFPWLQEKNKISNFMNVT